ncbi:MAG: GyrI-like domain-containing protein [Clostridiales bacterium]|nr:GyrI-like domain-containing protein [Clostridiales bacterium]
MEWRFETVEEKLIIGMNFYGDPFSVGGSWSVDNAIGKLWQRYSTYLSKHSDMILHRVSADESYECHVMDESFEDTGEYGIMVGVEVSSLNQQPVHLVSKVIPKRKYMVLILSGQEIVSDQQVFIDEILKENTEVSVDTSFFFEKYDKRFKGMHRIEESLVEIFIPLNHKDSSYG